MENTPFSLNEQTFAKLSREDLESLGKQAAVAYLSSDISLNDAIIKLARQHPSISSHQIRRVAEFANQETFSRLFADNEKYASDKNVEFKVADPGDILQTLNIQAGPNVISAPDTEYHCAPVKTASGVDKVAADIALAREFGFDVGSPGLDKAASSLQQEQAHREDFVSRLVPQQEKTATVADRILSAGEDGISPGTGSALTVDRVPDVAREETQDEAAQKEAMGGPESVMLNAQPQQHPEVTHRENMRGMERRIEIEKKKQELMSMQSKAVQAPGDMGGAPEPQMAQQGQMAAAPGGSVQGAPSPVTPEAAPGAPQIKQGSSVDEVLQYARMGRTKTAAVVADLEQGVSLESIKEAARARGQYPEANPFGDLVRTKQKLSTILDEAVVARDKNDFMMKEAEESFFYAATQHVLGGGNLGEVAHAMQEVPGNDNVISPVLAKLAQKLVGKGLDPAKLRADMIPYEMEKSAKVRPVNPRHPLVSTFAAYCSLASSQPVLDKAASDLEAKFAEVDSVLSQAMQQRRQNAKSA
jgi:hypothetical protein